MGSATYTLRIDTGTKERGRSFTGVVLALAIASGMHEMSQRTDPMRPVFLALAASAQETRPLLENLRGGRKATVLGPAFSASKGEKVELCKSAGYFWATQQTEAGDIITAHIPELFDFNPGLLETDIVKALVMPSREDCAALIAGRDADVADAIAHVRRVRGTETSAETVGLAALVCRYLAQRCELPIPPNLSFAAQLFLAASDVAVFSAPLGINPSYDSDGRDPAINIRKAIGFRAIVDARAPILPGVAIHATPLALEKLLSEQTRLFEQTRRGSSKAHPRALSRRAPAAEVV